MAEQEPIGLFDVEFSVEGEEKGNLIVPPEGPGTAGEKLAFNLVAEPVRKGWAGRR